MTTLRQGDRGAAVLELQTLLAMTGHDPGALDGAFGPRTQAAYTAATASTFAHDEDVADLRSLPRRAVELPRLLTPVSAVDMRIALVAGYASTFGDIAEAMASAALAVRVALAQLCVEHGCETWTMVTRDRLSAQGILPAAWLWPTHGEQAYIAVWRKNVGNMQVRAENMSPAPDHPLAAMVSRPTVPWFSMSPVEGSGATAHRATSAHYAYPNVAEGAAAYWRFLRDHCAGALAAFERGDPAAAAHELKISAWHFSGDEHEYARAMADRFASIK
jgi:hypothetical protein